MAFFDNEAFSPLIDCKLFWLGATLRLLIVIETRPGHDVETMMPHVDVSDAQIHSVRPGVHCISPQLSSPGFRRESSQSVVSWRSDSEDVTYSRSQENVTVP